MIRRLEFVIVALLLVIGAFSTGADFVFFLVYLGILVIGGGYVLTRFGLSDLEAGYSVDRLHAQVGDELRATYTLRNTSRLPKLWLEVFNPSTLPIALPGRALALGSHAERSWVARVPLLRRGHFRIDPMVVRTGDPFGLFESSATVGSGATVIVYPASESLPRWKLPPAMIEGANANPERTIQTTPLVTTIRGYVPGDAFNRIHWKSSARHQELQVKEFELEQTADLWLMLDLERAGHTGDGDEATIETAVRAAASVSARALVESRAIALAADGPRRVILPVDRGPRQHQKVMQLLAAVQPDGVTPLRDLLTEALPRLRRGMTALVITPSLERDWIRPLSALRSRNVACVVVLVDPLAHELASLARAGLPTIPDEEREERARAFRAMRLTLAEHELRTHVVVPGVPLGDQMVSTGGRVAVNAR
ncbi:MAG: hypothetical protein QOH61_657 [Chloroflexota bacterium]|jgi:uncharacterized protein (DUF58 family)|nr:hypothetical protein [Chloroflexota bacterium]